MWMKHFNRDGLKKLGNFFIWTVVFILCVCAAYMEGIQACSDPSAKQLKAIVYSIREFEENVSDWIRPEPTTVNPIAEEHRKRFGLFLKEAKDLMEQSGCLEKPPKAFISYAWDDRRSKRSESENKKMHKRLIRFKEDFGRLGIDTFLDIQADIQGHFRDKLQEHLEKADVIILAGTPLFKEKVSRHRLFLMTYLDLGALPRTGNSIALVKGADSIAAYYVEEGQHKEGITVSLTLTEIPWMATTSLVEAKSSEKTNEVLEYILPKLKAFKDKKEDARVTNAQFEYGCIMDKVNQAPEMLFPLLFKGDYGNAFPSDVQQNFIRDLRNEQNYFNQMASLSNPVGIIPAMCPALMSNQAYREAEKALKADLEKMTH